LEHRAIWAEEEVVAVFHSYLVSFLVFRSHLKRRTTWIFVAPLMERKRHFLSFLKAEIFGGLQSKKEVCFLTVGRVDPLLSECFLYRHLQSAALYRSP
jgi:hypothetical protein